MTEIKEGDMIQFHQAERRMSKLRLAIAGPAGSGKTYSALLIAFGMEAQSSKPKAQGARIALIDTERGSGDLYAHLGRYDVCSITAPFEPEKYTAAIQAAEEAGYEVIIIDSLSHAWSGEGGILDLHGHLADRSGNSWAAWRKVTPKHNRLVEAMLQSSCHIIATMRSKMEYTQATENGKTAVKKLGMNPIQRDGMEYEFTLFLDLDLDHLATATKDRTTLFDGKFFKPSQDTGRSLMAWLGEGRGQGLEVGGRRSEDGGQRSEDGGQGLEVGGQRLEAEGQGEDESSKLKAESEDRRGHSAEDGLPPTSTLQPAASSPQGGNGGNGKGNGLSMLFAKLGGYGIDREAYRAYCHQKYAIPSMKEMTPAQREEQIKILNSLRNDDRLEEFKRILLEIASRKEQGAGSDEQGAGGKEREGTAESETKPAEKPVGNPEEWVPPVPRVRGIPGLVQGAEFNYF
jgi:hypothetical protein